MKKVYFAFLIVLLNINVLLSVGNNYECISWETFVSEYENAPILETGEDFIIIEIDGQLYKVKLPT